MRFRTAQIVLRAADFALTQTHYAAAFTKTLDVYFRATHDSCSNFVAEPVIRRFRDSLTVASVLQQSGAHTSVSYGLAANPVLSYLAGYEAARARANAKSSQKHKKIGVRLSRGKTVSRTPIDGLDLEDASSRGRLRSGPSQPARALARRFQPKNQPNPAKSSH